MVIANRLIKEANTGYKNTIDTLIQTVLDRIFNRLSPAKAELSISKLVILKPLYSNASILSFCFGIKEANTGYKNTIDTLIQTVLDRI